MKKFFKKLEIIFIVLILLALVIRFIDTGTKHLKGDGYEYAVMSQSFVNHLSPDARLDDITQIKNNMQQNASFHIDAKKIFSGYENMIHNQLDSSYGYFKTDNNQFYCYHFWLYPLVNAPALWLVEKLQISPVRSFHITNLIIFLITIIFLSKVNFLNKKQKYFISAFYLTCGTSYYVSWSHPEVFAGSLLLMGLVLLLNRRFIIAALLFALAAQQNPPIGILAAITLLIQLFISSKLFLKKEMLSYQLFKSMLVMGAVSFVLLLSPIFYYLHFKTTNLIVKHGGSLNDLISFNRLHSVFFDFNQGIIVASLFTMILIVFLNVLYLIRPTLRKNRQTKRNIVLALLMVIFSIILALPSLSAPNWNPGECIFLRYGYWISMPLGIAAMLLISELPLRMYLTVFIPFLLGQSWLVYHHGITGREDYLENKPLAIFLYENYPNAYNPIPVIFIERGLHAEQGAASKKIYFYVNKKSRVSKILYHQSHSSAISPCHGKPIDELKKSEGDIVSTEQGWFYINFRNDSCVTDLAPGFYSI